MDVDIHAGGGELEHEHGRRIARMVDEAAVGFGDGVLDGAVADSTPVDEDVLVLVGAAGDGGGAGQAPEGDAAAVVVLVGVDFEELGGELFAEDGDGSLAGRLVGGKVEGLAAVDRRGEGGGGGGRGGGGGGGGGVGGGGGGGFGGRRPSRRRRRRGGPGRVA